MEVSGQPVELRSALLIGVGRYKNSKDLKDLQGPRVDVNNMKSVLEDPAVGAYRVKTLEDVDSSTACEQLEDFLRDRAENETCLIYFSGHGFIDARGALYLCTTNASFMRPRTSTIPAEFISRLIDDCQSKRVVLMLDCCYAGNYDGSAKSADVVQPQFGGTGLGRVVLTAGAENQLAWDNGEKGSLFSRHIAEGIRSGAADTDGDGRITVQELYDYVYKKVVSERSSQRPGKNTYRESGPSFLIAESPTKRVDVPAWLHHELGSVVPETRLNAIKSLKELYETQPRARDAVVARLRAALEDDSNRVRKVAQEILHQLEVTEPPPPPPPPLPPKSQEDAGPDPKSIPDESDEREKAPPKKPVAAFPISGELPAWLLWSFVGTTIFFVFPGITGLIGPYGQGIDPVAASLLFVAFATFCGVRYQLVPSWAAIFRSVSWWTGASGLLLGSLFMFDNNPQVEQFIVFLAVSALGHFGIVKFTIRSKVVVTICLALLLTFIWAMSFFVLPRSFYGTYKWTALFLIMSGLFISLGTLIIRRQRKSWQTNPSFTR